VLPYGRQTIEDDDIAAVAAALRDDFLTTGPRVEAFERSRDGRRRHAAACPTAWRCTGDAGAGVADEVVVPSITFWPSPTAPARGAEVVFADVDPSGLMTPQTLQRPSRRRPPSRRTAGPPARRRLRPARRWRPWPATRASVRLSVARQQGAGPTVTFGQRRKIAMRHEAGIRSP
jgi:hypothetical protein